MLEENAFADATAQIIKKQEEKEMNACFTDTDFFSRLQSRQALTKAGKIIKLVT